TSHAHNWRVTNLKVTRLASGASSTALAMNGAYNIALDNVSAQKVGTILGFGTGEALFLNPWTGQDDIGSLPQMPQDGTNLMGTSGAGRNIWIRNVTGTQISGTGIQIDGAEHPGGWISSSGTVIAWLPGATCAINQLVYNGAYKYKLTTAAGPNESVSPYHGPTGTTTYTDANGNIWTYQGVAYGTGYRGWGELN